MGKLTVLLAALILTCAVASAVSAQVGLDWVPTGSGARALGMGGAFTAIADDATASWWNPAGLSQLERPEVSIVGQYRSIEAESRELSIPELRTGTKDTNSINFASVVFPLGGTTQGARKSLSLSYGTFMDFNSEVSGPTTYMKNNGTIDNAALTFSTELTPNLSIGAGVIRIFGGFDEDRVYGPGDTEIRHQKIYGFGAAVGLLWKGKTVNLGLMARTQSHIRMDSSGYRSLSGSYHEVGSINYPHSLGVGVAYKPTENFTAALDVHYLNLSKFNIDDPNALVDIYQPGSD